MVDAQIKWFPKVYSNLDNENCHDNDKFINAFQNILFILIITQL